MESIIWKPMNITTQFSGDWNLANYIQYVVLDDSFRSEVVGFIFGTGAWKSVFVILTVLVMVPFVWTRWHLKHIPGPFLASLTNFQRVAWVRTKRAHLILQDMHEKYGEVVRIGPNMVSFSNPDAIPTVYTTRVGFPKVGLVS
jgi:hypothetical protein